MKSRTFVKSLFGSHSALFALAFAFGGLVTLSLAPFNLAPFAIIALMGLHYLLNRTDLKKGMWVSLGFGFGLIFCGAHWLYVSMHDHGGTPALLAALLTSGFCLWIGSWLLPFTLFYQKFCRHHWLGQTLGFAALYVLSEWMRTWFLTGFPWLFIGYSQTEQWLFPYAPIIGTFGISFILAFTAAAIVHCITQPKHSALFVAAAGLWLLALPLKHCVWTEPIPDKPPYSVAMVQGNVALDVKWLNEYKKPNMDYYLTEIKKLAGTDIILLPETAITEYEHKAGDWLYAVDKALTEHGSALITGIPSARWNQAGKARIYNSLTSAGLAHGRYDKHKLVPFGEFIPFEEQLNSLLDLFDIPMTSFSSGEALQSPIIAKDAALQPYICYEVMYPDYVTKTALDSDILITVSNDAWFGRSIGPLQHVQMAQMRAKETGRYFLRSTNTGLTAIIDEQGHIQQSIPRFEQGVLQGQAFAMRGTTPVMRMGTLPIVLFSFIILGFILFHFYLTSKHYDSRKL